VARLLFPLVVFWAPQNVLVNKERKTFVEGWRIPKRGLRHETLAEEPALVRARPADCRKSEQLPRPLCVRQLEEAEGASEVAAPGASAAAAVLAAAGAPASAGAVAGAGGAEGSTKAPQTLSQVRQRLPHR
jgi:hypothetical protein